MDAATFSDRLEARLERGRTLAEARMLSRVTVKREDTQNPSIVDGIEVPTWEIIYADHPFRLDSGSTSDGGSRGVTVGGVTFQDATGVGHFPYPSAELRDGDVLEVTAGEWTGDFYRIVAALRFDQQTARHIPITETRQPNGWSS